MSSVHPSMPLSCAPDSSAGVLLCNAGSSTLKLARYRQASAPEQLWQGHFEGDEQTLVQALAAALLVQPAPVAVLHRIVHAGAVSEAPHLLDAAMRAQIAHWSPLAPLHNPLALRLSAVVSTRWPEVPQYAVFDSGLYAHLPDVAAHYALPASLSPRWPLRRYGFHGLAHRSQWRLVQALSAASNRPHPRRLISLQLGSGCSLTTWRDDIAVDNTMGFTPLEGLVMARRSGSIDPGILLHLLRDEGMSVEELERLLSSGSGLAAMAAGQGDMRALMQQGTVNAQAALAHYCYQIRKAIGAAIAVLGGVDAISIGGGVGEHQPQVRQQILTGLEELGIVSDATLNAGATQAGPLHSRESRVSLWLCPVNEMQEMFMQYVTAIAGCQENE